MITGNVERRTDVEREIMNSFWGYVILEVCKLLQSLVASVNSLYYGHISGICIGLGTVILCST